MKFIFALARKNLIKKPYRTLAMILLAALAAFTVFAGSIVVLSLNNGLKSYGERLGADVMVVPSEARTSGSFDDILLQGITGNYYITEAQLNRALSGVEGIEKVSTQFYLASVTASCCSSKLQIIGFDPETDFTVQPWIRERYSESLGDGDIIVGADITLNSSMTLQFYNVKCKIVARLDKTGTGLDTAVYTTIETIRQMAENAVILEHLTEGYDVSTSVSAAMIKVADGFDAQSVAGKINGRKGVKATTAQSYVSGVASGLNNVAGVIGAMVAVVWLLAAALIVVSFVMVCNERMKEFAVLRAMGASSSMNAKLLLTEIFAVTAIGAVTGVIFSAIVTFPLTSLIKSALSLPYLLPSFWAIALTVLGAIAATLVAGAVSALFAVARLNRSDAGLMLREDA